MPTLIFVVPSLNLTGPIKGAIALATNLSEQFDIHFIVLSKKVSVISYPNFVYHFLPRLISPFLVTKLIHQYFRYSQVIIFSLCFSADLVNLFTPKNCVSVSSVRGQLFQLYRIEKGFIGVCFALLHYFILSRLDHVVCMSHAMSREYRSISGKKPIVIGNFIDEKSLSITNYQKESNNSSISISYVGRLVDVKAPDLLVKALSSLVLSGVSAHLYIVGDGPLLPNLKSLVSSLALQDQVTLYGHLDDPWSVLAHSDCFVLPSLSEGISRASLEALHLGIPCILRNVSSNSELIKSGINGYLFDSPLELPQLILQASSLNPYPPGAHRPSLVPLQFSETHCTNAYRSLFLSLVA